MANIYGGKATVSLAVREIQVKTTLVFYYTPVIMVINRQQNSGDDAREKGSLHVIPLDVSVEASQKH